MARRRSNVVPKCSALWVSLCVLIFHSLDVVAYRAAPVIAGQASRARRDASCVDLGAWREREDRERDQEAANRISSAAPCSRKDVLQSVGLDVENVYNSGFPGVVSPLPNRRRRCTCLSTTCVVQGCTWDAVDLSPILLCPLPAAAS